MQQNYCCIYCGNKENLTKDHIPPKNLFPPPKPSNLITVPSCKKCNKGFEMDDVYFRNIIATSKESLKTSSAEKLTMEKILPSIRKQNAIGLTMRIMQSMTHIDKYSESGLLIGKEPAYFTEIDRIKRVVNRTVKGLFYHEREEILPKQVQLQTRLVQYMEDIDPSLLQLFGQLEEKRIGEDVFIYRYHIFPERPFLSIWFLFFYKAHLFITRTFHELDPDGI